MHLIMYFLIISTLIITNLAVESLYSMKLEKGWFPSEGLTVNELTSRSRQRSIVTFPVTAIPSNYMGYITRVKLGNPPKEFRVLIDSGSDILWIPCNGCKDCPVTRLPDGQQSSRFDPQQSSTASMIDCSDSRCIFSGCLGSCSYNITYVDGDTSEGYFMSDELHLSTVMESERVANSSVRIIFGCSNLVTGNLVINDVFDGILGLGQGSGLSIFSQLVSAGVSPMVFSYCLGGSSEDGSSLVFGEVVEPDIMYTHLDLSESRYNVHLQSIMVNGQPLHVDSSIFKISKTTGTIIDSGTLLAYLPEEVYNHFVNAIYSSVRPSQVQPTTIDLNHCFETYNSIYEAFPMVTLNFVDGARMELNPSNYLEFYRTSPMNNKSIWCIEWSNSKEGIEDGLTLLGDIVLKDKIIIYDLIHQRMGWKQYNCSLSVNVSTNTIIGPIKDHHGGNRLSKWSKDAIFVGAPIGALIIIVIIVMIICRFR